MEILALLDRLETLIQDATRVPLTGKVLVDPDEVLNLIDEMRDAMPAEVRAAGQVAATQEEILAGARAEADQLIREAREYVEQLTAESAVLTEARARSEEMVEQAKRVAREIRTGALEYADQILGRLEENVRKAHETIRASREELHR